MRGAILSTCVLAWSVSAAWGQMSTVINDDFESGLGAWSTRAALPWPVDLNGMPVLFGANDPLLHQLDGVTHESQSAGFASDEDPWDSSLAAWMEKRFEGIVPAGTYHLHLELDRYVYKDPAYRAPEPPDPYATAARTFLLSDESYASPCFNFDGSMPASAIRSSYNAGTSIDDPSANSGKWSHLIIDKPTFDTATGNFELRLLMHEKYKGAQAAAWDNISFTLSDPADPNAVLFSFTEDFESGLDVWTVRSFEANFPHDDTPRTFTAADPLLFDNTGNPGSASAGFTSDISCLDDTRAAWMYRLFPTLLPPGTYAVSIDMDAYVYKDPAKLPDDAQALGNRVFVLTDEAYDNPAFAFDTETPAPGFAYDLWRGDDLFAANGVWQHLHIYQDVTTTTGNFEVRLLMQDKDRPSLVVTGEPALPEPTLWTQAPGNQTVAWDNVQVRIGPPCYTPRFDADGDGDVDQDDFAEFQLCYTGADAAAGIVDFERCRCMRGDADNDIDRDDLAAFNACVSGPSVPADAYCEDHLPPP